MIITSWKLGPSLAMGNSIVVKPAENSTLSALKLAQLAIEAGLPDGVFNVVPGLGAEAGQALARHMDVAKIAFTGSAPTVRKMMQYAAGQTCNAGSRLIIEKGVKEELFAHLHKFLEVFVVGDQFEPATQMAGLVSHLQRDRVNSYQDLIGENGKKLIFGGQKSTGNDLFISPTLVDNVKPDSRLAQEEIFGPVLVAIDANDADQALEIANGTEYGLAAAVWTSNIARAHKFPRKLRAGTVWINTFDALDVITPFGGFGSSGSDRDKSLHALDAYSALKTTWVDLN